MTQNDDRGRAIFCHVFRRLPCYGKPHKQEQAAATDPRAQKLPQEKIAKTMPPAIAYVQEGWDIRDIPHLWSDEEPDEEGDEAPR